MAAFQATYNENNKLESLAISLQLSPLSEDGKAYLALVLEPGPLASKAGRMAPLRLTKGDENHISIILSQMDPARFRIVSSRSRSHFGIHPKRSDAASIIKKQSDTRHTKNQK